ncbi:MAG: matrix protein [Dermacentor reticulatus rhabdovirus 1]|uniref:Matrix protein n=1 Tax=Dermacentor reticulatus rhabdovirus 1 TaxID=2950732 RepID=A0AAE9LUJ3_9RHAB|nr:MAG: matrix protein [Dermacentor reticulatus rhabdovirus 1]
MSAREVTGRPDRSSPFQPPPRPSISGTGGSTRRSVNFDIDARLTVRAPRSGLLPGHFMTFGPLFRSSYVGESHAESLNAFLVGLMAGRLTEHGSEGEEHVYKAIFREDILLEGPSRWVPLNISGIYRDTAHWRMRGETYTWAFFIDRMPTIFEGVPVENLIRGQDATLYRLWDISFHEDVESGHLLPIRSIRQQSSPRR